jgi:uncharacterized membrane protein YkvA (DUF1232 family)
MSSGRRVAPLALAILRSPMSRTSRSRGRIPLTRTLNYLAFLPLASRAPTYGRLVYALARDPRVPGSRKALLGAAAAYVVSPIDLVPDVIPLVGALDDVAILVLAMEVFLEGLPGGILDEKLRELDIDVAAFERDRARIRRLIPGPLRHVISRFPGAVRGLGSLIRQTGIDSRLRALIAQEVVLA